MNQSPLRPVRLPGAARRPALLIGTLAASALALSACGGGDDDGAQPPASPTAPTSSSSAPTQPSTSSPASATDAGGSASPTASPTGSAALSLDMPEALSGERVTALREVVQRAAGPGAELAEDLSSPLERHTSLQGEAENLEALVTAGEPDGTELDERQQACLDAARDVMESDADAGAAQATWFAQPATAGTTAGTTGGSVAPTGREAEVQPLSVQVAVYPDEAAAAASLEAARDASETCEGTVLSGIGVVSLEPLNSWPDGQGFTVLPGPETSIYAVATSVQAGDRVFTVMQADDDGGVPEGAEDRARQLIEELEAAMDG